MESEGPVEQRRKLISIVTPCYNEEANVRECYETVRRIVEAELPGYDHEHVFSDNCSTDGTVAILREIAASDRRVKIIVNSRNFGAFHSIFNALLATAGDGVVVMLAADLQDPPEVIPEFVRRWEAGAEVVFGVRRQREEGLVMRFLRRRYYRLVARFAEISIPTDVGEFTFVDRRVVEALRRFEDYYPYVRGMIASCGFRTDSVEYAMRARKRGLSHARLWHLIDQGMNGLISFTRVPLRLTLMLGFAVSALSLTYALVSFCFNLVYYKRLAPPGVPTIVISIFFFAGLQLFLIGVLGEYVGAIHSQVRKRPLVIERERVNFGPPAPP
jgi:glycosyltransferase involved in cell wall biosynthesis